MTTVHLELYRKNRFISHCRDYGEHQQELDKTIEDKDEKMAEEIDRQGEQDRKVEALNEACMLVRDLALNRGSSSSYDDTKSHKKTIKVLRASIDFTSELS